MHRYGSSAYFFDRTGTLTELQNRSMRCIDIVRHDAPLASVETHQLASGEKSNEQPVIDAYETEC
jgi:hypothetical protein